MSFIFIASDRNKAPINQFIVGVDYVVCLIHCLRAIRRLFSFMAEWS